MGTLISWVWSFAAGMLSAISMVVSWGAFISVIFAVIGVIRGRCKWYTIPIYLLVCIVASLLFRSLFWVSDRIARPDVVSTALFWTSTFLAGMGGLKYGFQMLKETWVTTNGMSQKE